MVYEIKLTGFDWKRATTNDEHKYILSELFGKKDDNVQNVHVVYCKFGNDLLVRTCAKPVNGKFTQYEPSFIESQKLLVSMVVNPTDEHKNPISNINELKEWLIRHGKKRYGFDVIDFSHVIMSPRKLRSSDGRTHTKHRVHINAVISITDSDAFTNAYTTGIGGGKSYGFGLICINNLIT